MIIIYVFFFVFIFIDYNTMSSNEWNGVGIEPFHFFYFSTIVYLNFSGGNLDFNPRKLTIHKYSKDEDYTSLSTHTNKCNNILL